MKSSKYRFLIPNGITFISLTCGILAIMLSVNGELKWAGWLILASYVLDLFDGASARKLNASSEFGLQLDSLVDMVSLGTAPAILYFVYIQELALPTFWVWVAVVMVPLAGAYRLARFNLLPPKETGSNDSVGLTISTGGATLALIVLTDSVYQHPSTLLPAFMYLVLPVVISVLMVSRIAFPSLSGVVGGKKRGVVWLTVIGTSLFIWPQYPFVKTWFLFTSGYLGASVARAGLYFKR